MRRFILVAIPVVMLIVCACATPPKAKDLEPSSLYEPPAPVDVQPAPAAQPHAAQAPAVQAPSVQAPAAHVPARKGAAVQEPPQADLENKPLPVVPADPPPLPNAEDLGDDNWGRDQRHTKLKDKDREKIKGSDPEDDGWGRE